MDERDELIKKREAYKNLIDLHSDELDKIFQDISDQFFRLGFHEDAMDTLEDMTTSMRNNGFSRIVRQLLDEENIDDALKYIHSMTDNLEKDTYFCEILRIKVRLGILEGRHRVLGYINTPHIKEEAKNIILGKVNSKNTHTNNYNYLTDEDKQRLLSASKNYAKQGELNNALNTLSQIYSPNTSGFLKWKNELEGIVKDSQEINVKPTAIFLQRNKDVFLNLAKNYAKKGEFNNALKELSQIFPTNSKKFLSWSKKLKNIVSESIKYNNTRKKIEQYSKSIDTHAIEDDTITVEQPIKTNQNLGLLKDLNKILKDFYLQYEQYDFSEITELEFIYLFATYLETSLDGYEVLVGNKSVNVTDNIKLFNTTLMRYQSEVVTGNILITIFPDIVLKGFGSNLSRQIMLEIYGINMNYSINDYELVKIKSFFQKDEIDKEAYIIFPQKEDNRVIGFSE